MLLNAEYSKDEKELIIKYSKSYNKEIKFITMKEFLFNEDKNILKIRQGREFMFYGYSIDRWIGVIEWFGIISILGLFVFFLSAYLTNKYSNTNKIYRIKKKTTKKKQWFYDVA